MTPSLSFAGRYMSLKFTSVTGDTYTISTNNLAISIHDKNLLFNNTDLIIPFESLSSMEFTDYDNNSTIINTVIQNKESRVEVYKINGTLHGSFGSMSEAWYSLPQGLYVIKDDNGNTFKVNIGK